LLRVDSERSEKVFDFSLHGFRRALQLEKFIMTRKEIEEIYLTFLFLFKFISYAFFVSGQAIMDAFALFKPGKHFLVNSRSAITFPHITAATIAY